LAKEKQKNFVHTMKTSLKEEKTGEKEADILHKP